MPPLSWPRALALSALSGLLLAPAILAQHLAVFAFLAYAPLYLAIQGQSPRRAATLGLLSGVAYSVPAYWWVADTIAHFGGPGQPVSSLLVVALSVANAVRIAIPAWVAARAAQRGWPEALVFVLAFLGAEIAYPLFLPYYLGVGVVQALPLVQVAELGGMLAVDLVVITFAVGLGEGLRAARSRRLPAVGAWVAMFAVPALAWGWGTVRIGQVRAAMADAPSVYIGLVQPDVPAGGSDDVPWNREATLALANRGVDLVLWPEVAVHTSFNEDTWRKRIPERITSGLGVPVLFGTRTWEESPVAGEPRLRRNVAVLVDDAGVPIGRYDKHQLVPFGEFIPFSDWFPVLRGVVDNDELFIPGAGVQPIEWGTHRIAALICYEDILPSYVNRHVSAVAPDLLVTITNDAWFGDTAEPWIHLTEARIRAIEHRRYLVRSANSGPSGLVDPVGALGDTSGLFVKESRIVEARWMSGTTLYERIGDLPWWGAGALAMVAAFVRRPGSKRAAG